jgi:hypothetical protein
VHLSCRTTVLAEESVSNATELLRNETTASLEPALMKHATSRALFAYWYSLRKNGQAPERADIEPGAIRHILADTFIIEHDRPAGHPFRLAGTRLCALFGRELRSAGFVSLWPVANRRDGDMLVEAAADGACGVVAGLAGTTAHGRRIELEAVLLPLSHRGQGFARLIGAVSPAAPPSLLGLDPVQDVEQLSMRILGVAPADALVTRSQDRERLSLRRTLRLVQGGLSIATSPLDAR